METMLNELKWDSDFFGFKIGRITLSPHVDNIDRDGMAVYENQIRNEGYKLVYLFIEEDGEDDGRKYESLLKPFSYDYIDNKIVYRKELVSCPAEPSVTAFTEGDSIDELYKLVLESGHLSRFNLDKRFGEDAFRRLYRRWMENSLNGEMADVALVYKVDGHIGGFITVKVKGDTGVLGLMAIDHQYRGRGIAKKLQAAAQHYALTSGCRAVSADTQKTNEITCHLYDTLGYSVGENISIFHKWIE